MDCRGESNGWSPPLCGVDREVTRAGQGYAKTKLSTASSAAAWTADPGQAAPVVRDGDYAIASTTVGFARYASNAIPDSFSNAST
jgi:hypothetical protein